MNLDWHNYKSGRTGKIAGAYLYIPELTEKNVGHVCHSTDGSWSFHPYVVDEPRLDSLVALGPFDTLEEAKLHASCAVAEIMSFPLPTNFRPKVLQLNFDFAKAF